MSKLSRIIQSETAKTNWTEMAKMLFWGDNDQGRRNNIAKLRSYKRTGDTNATEQIQNLLVLMLILTVAEKRTEEAYQQDFSQRCDAISLNHGLDEDQYWPDGKVPIEWEKLDIEFEARSNQILQKTLREYSMNEIADRVEIGGAREFIRIIKNIEVQIFKTLKTLNKAKRKNSIARPVLVK